MKIILNKYFVRGFDPVFDLWFAGIPVLLYIFFRNILNWQGEELEWMTWFYGFIISIIIIFLIIIKIIRINLYFKFLLSLPFYLFIFSNVDLTYSAFIFFASSVILWLGESIFSDNKGVRWQNVGHVLYYFVLFQIASKLIYWAKFDDFIWLKVKETSNYFKYAQIIELVTPILVIIIFVTSLLLFVLSGSKEIIWKPLTRYWWIIPGILFFFEAFNTTGFFSKEGGGPMFHWHDFVGPIELMQQGGYLLWDFPASYGFLRFIAIYLIPVQDAWQKTYLLNSSMQLAYSLLIFKVIWQQKGLIWYVISIGLTLAIVFYLSGHPPTMSNSNHTPTGGALRFFWLVLMMYVIVSVRYKNLSSQVYIILPIWIIGFLWSVESAVYVTVILGPFSLYHLMHGNNKLKERIKLLMVFPLGLLAVIFFISLFYLFMLGHLPDYWAFVEFIFYAHGGSYFAESINIQGPIWVTLIIVSWMLSHADKYTKKYSMYCVMAFVAATWIIFPYWVAHSVEVVIFKLMVPVYFGLFLLFSMLEKQNRIKYMYSFSPLLIIILVMTFGTPQTAKHVYDAFSNQDYTLENTIDEEVDDMHQIFSMITPGDVPVTYVDPGRYRFMLRSNQYKDSKTGKIVALNNKIWLPLHPADLFWDNMPLERKVEYIDRWLKRHPVNKGWVVNANDRSHWWKRSHSIYEIALKEALSEKFQIKKIVEYGDLKAVLYEKIL